MGGFLVLLSPRDVDGIVEERFLNQSIEHTDEFALDLDFDGLGFHKALVFLLKYGAAKG